LAEQGSRERFGVALFASAGSMLGVALVFANAGGQTAQTLLGPFAVFVESIAEAGERLAALAVAARSITVPLVGAVLLVVGLWFYRGRPESAAPIVAAWAFAALGQLVGFDRDPWAAVALYALAIGVYASRRIEDTDASEVDGSLAYRSTLMGVTLALALFLLIGIHRLDVYPSFYFDEGAYLNAARMQIGSLEPGTVARYGSEEVYSFERFRFQWIPLWIQSTGLLAMQPELLSLRLVSLSAMFAALVVATTGLRKRIGSVPVVGMVAMAAASPLTLGYSRPGFYVSITILHGVLCLIALLRLEQRWDTRAALLTGLLLGASLYLYQLSWFVPVLALVVFASTPELWRRARCARIFAIVTATAAAVALPGLLAMPEGLRSVTAQTFDKAAWNPMGGVPLGVVVAPDGIGHSGADEFVETHRSDDLTASRSSTGVRPVVVFFGAEPAVDHALLAANHAGWHSLGGEVTRSAFARVSDIAKRLFYLPGWESGGRWVDGSLLNPWVAPLLILGLVEAFRRRRVFVFRLLGLWVLVGALLPASIGGGFPRRTVLILPVVFAIASLPLAVWYRSGATVSSRAIAAGMSVLWLLGGVAFGTHHYFRHWDQRISLGPSYPVLAFDKALNALPADERIFAPRVLGRDWKYLHPAGSQRARSVALVRNTDEGDAIRAHSCKQPPPFSWVVPDVPAIRARFAGLADDFAIDEQTLGPYVLIRVQSLRPGGCAIGSASRNRPQPDVDTSKR
jgi:hypothetical protein